MKDRRFLHTKILRFVNSTHYFDFYKLLDLTLPKVISGYLTFLLYLIKYSVHNLFKDSLNTKFRGPDSTQLVKKAYRKKMLSRVLLVSRYASQVSQNFPFHSLRRGGDVNHGGAGPRKRLHFWAGCTKKNFHTPLAFGTLWYTILTVPILTCVQS